MAILTYRLWCCNCSRREHVSNIISIKENNHTAFSCIFMHLWDWLYWLICTAFFLKVLHFIVYKYTLQLPFKHSHYHIIYAVPRILPYGYRLCLSFPYDNSTGTIVTKMLLLLFVLWCWTWKQPLLLFTSFWSTEFQRGNIYTFTHESWDCAVTFRHAPRHVKQD